MNIEDYIDFKVFFTTMCIVIAYKYIKKNKLLNNI